MAQKYLKFFVFIWLTLLYIPFSYAGSTTTSNITAATVITRVRADLNEASASFWTEANLLQWIDEAVWEVVNRTQPLESGVSDIIVIENTRFYSIPSTISGVSFGSVVKVEYDMGLSGNTIRQPQIYDLTRVPFTKLRGNEEKEKGNPKTFSVWANNLYIWPIPRSTQAGNTIYIYNAGFPSGVTATASPIETPAYFDLALLHYVKAKGLFRDRQEAKAGGYLKMFYDMIEYYRQNIMKRDIFNPQQ